MEMDIFDSWIDAVLLIDTEQRLQYINSAFAVLIEVSQKRIKLNSSLSDFLTFEDPDHWLGRKGEWIGPDQVPFREMSFVTAKGKQGRVQATVNRRPEGILVFLRDVSLEEALQKKYRLELEQKEEAYRKLEEYNLTLEQKVQERTQQLSVANRTIAAMLDSLGQGFFLFSEDGICGPVFSRACETIIECKPADRDVGDVLRIPDAKRLEFDRWKKALFSNLLPVEDLLPLGPKTFPHSQGLVVELTYRAIVDDKSEVKAIVVVATDRTREQVARRDAERERAHAQLITRIVMARNQFQKFLRNLRNLNSALSHEQSRGKSAFENHETWLRSFHTLKGDAGAYGLLEIEKLAHQCEEALINRQFQRLDEWNHAIAGELDRVISEYGPVIGRGWDQSDRWLEIPSSQIQSLAQKLSANPLTRDMGEEIISQFLSEPVEGVFAHYSGTVVRLARELGKEVEPLKIVGGELRMRPEVILPVANEFVHVFRNVVDHGIEPASQRESLGKPRAAKIVLQFSRQPTGALLITVVDDGPGIDPELIRARLLKKGVSAADLAREKDEDVIQHVFDSGFSTRESASFVSGRGVGLDALRAAVQRSHGRVWVNSVRGRGTQLFAEIPGIWSPQIK